MSLGRTTRGEGTSLVPALGVDGERINRQLRELAQFGKNPYGGVSRVAYSEFDRQGREWAMDGMREAGLAVSIDAAGNIFGRRPGAMRSLKPLVFGSHIDSVPDGGNYDGDVGSLSAIEVARTLRRTQLVTQSSARDRHLPERGRRHCRSRALIGELTADDLSSRRRQRQDDRRGHRVLGGDLVEARSVKRTTGDIAALLRAAHRAGRQSRREQDRHRRRRGHRRHRAVGGDCRPVLPTTPARRR